MNALRSKTHVLIAGATLLLALILPQHAWAQG